MKDSIGSDVFFQSDQPPQTHKKFQNYTAKEVRGHSDHFVMQKNPRMQDNIQLY